MAQLIFVYIQENVGASYLYISVLKWDSEISTQKNLNMYKISELHMEKTVYKFIFIKLIDLTKQTLFLGHGRNFNLKRS